MKNPKSIVILALHLHADQIVYVESSITKQFALVSKVTSVNLPIADLNAF